MSESAFEERGTRLERQVALVKKSTATVALVTASPFIEIDESSIEPEGENGKMATQADVDAFWSKAAQHLKPHFEAVTASTVAQVVGHIDRELKPVKGALAEHNNHLTMIEKTLDEIKQKIG